MSPTRWLALSGFALGAAGVWEATRWPDSDPALACDARDVGWVEHGGELVASCAPPGSTVRPPGAQARSLGLKLELNAAPEADLAEIPGIGPSLAHTLVAGRKARDGFLNWDEVRGVRGVGPAKLKLLQQATVL